MLTGPGVLQWKFFILEPSVFIPRGGGHSRTFQLEGMKIQHIEYILWYTIVYSGIIIYVIYYENSIDDT